jgi:endonuclease-3
MLPKLIARLESHYGPQPKPLSDPWHLILWENVAYLAEDDRRRQAFDILKKYVGLKPQQIVAASDDALLEVTRHGILPKQFVKKLRDCARIMLDEFGGDLSAVLKLPLAKAKKALRKFPGIGEPGAEKILLFTKTHPVLALDSNGLRVLLRLGFGEENKNYAALYRSFQQAVASDMPGDAARLIATYQLLRRHGQELCRRSEPLCGQCPLAANCRYFQRRSQAKRRRR